MSLDYWNMKLSGAYVEHDGRIRYIERAHWQDDPEDEKEREYTYPEDTLPYIYFELNSGGCVSFDEFTIKFPDDQWYRTDNGKLARIERNMNRQYKIAPTSDMFHIMGRSNIKEALESCDRGDYDTSESIWDWDKPNHLFSKHMALLPETPTLRYLMYHGTTVAKMERGKDYIQLTPMVSNLPRKVEAIWGNRFDERVPAPEIEETLASGTLYYAWQKADRWDEFILHRNNDMRVVYYCDHLPEGIVVFSGGSTLKFESESDSELLWADGQISTELRNDIRILYQQFKEKFI